MTDLDRPDVPSLTTERLVHACEAAETQVPALIAIVAPHAKSRPDAPVEGDVLQLARRSLRPSHRIARALGAPSPLPLHPPVSNAGLAARLELALTHTRLFRRRYFGYSNLSQTVTWHVRDWLIVAMRRNAEAAQD